MNKLIAVSLFAAAAAFTVAPQTARAGDETAAAIGGFIGGLILGSALDNDGHHHDHGVHVSTRVVINGHGHRHGHYDRHRHHDHGYWDVQRVRVWVPGRWVVHVDDCGIRHRHFERGHYEYRRERVWVSSGRGRCEICH